MPTPSYPIHRVAPRLAGAHVVTAPVEDGVDALAAAAIESRARAVVLSYPHNPTTSVVDLPDLQRLVDAAREHGFVLVHDFAYADIAFDGYEPPSILQAEGAEECAVELYSLTKSFSMAGWRVGFVLGRADVVQALAKLKSYLDYGTSQPALGTMFVWAPIPGRLREIGSLELALRLARSAGVAVSPGIGFGAGGDGHVRFALVENEQRIGQATRAIRKLLQAHEVTAP